jgi:hypothetical protein
MVVAQIRESGGIHYNVDIAAIVGHALEMRVPITSIAPSYFHSGGFNCFIAKSLFSYAHVMPPLVS